MHKLRHDVSKYEGYAKAIVLSHYSKFPDYIKRSLEIDDCVQDSLLYLHQTLNRLGDHTVKFDSDRSKLTSWVYTILNSHLTNLLKSSLRKKRMTILVSLDDLTLRLGTAGNTSNAVRIREAKDKVVSLHLKASPELLEFIDDNLYHAGNRLKITRTRTDHKFVINRYTKTPRKVYLTKEEIFKKRKQEFKSLASQCGVTSDDYRLALMVEPRERAAV